MPKSNLPGQFPNGTRAIWLLPIVFYASDIYDFDAITDINLIEGNKPYLIKCIELTNYIFITPAELTAIKHQLQNEIIPFKIAMEEWAIACRKETNGVSTFKNKVMPTIKDTQAAIENNAILKHSRSIETGKLVTSLYFGEVNPPMLWKYYTLHDLMTEEEFDRLEEEYNSQPAYTLPIILFIPESIPFQRIDIDYYAKLAEQIEPTEVVATKKSINID